MRRKPNIRDLPFTPPSDDAGGRSHTFHLPKETGYTTSTPRAGASERSPETLVEAHPRYTPLWRGREQSPYCSRSPYSEGLRAASRTRLRVSNAQNSLLRRKFLSIWGTSSFRPVGYRPGRSPWLVM